MLKRSVKPASLYLLMETATSLLFQMIFVASSLYQVTTAGLSPLQLVLAGTTLEAAVFLFEVPTGVIADIYSRKLSIVIGYLLMGAGFLVEGFFPAFWPILFAQVLWGLGFTFTSGAGEAWISDEAGEEKANRLFLQAARVGLYASLAGMGLAVRLGTENIAVPIRWGGLGLILLGLLLIPAMPEHGFRPAPRADRSTRQQMFHTFRAGAAVVRSRPQMLSILGVGLFYGLYSEGFDRLWVKHMVDTFELPLFAGSPVAFFSILRAAGSIAGIAVLHPVEQRLDTGSFRSIARAMLFFTAVISMGLAGFALSPVLGLAFFMYLLVTVARTVAAPLYTAWVNRRLETGSRATVLSMASQVDAVGQICGGPAVGLVARMMSVVAALLSSSALVVPAFLLIRRADRQAETDP